MSDKSISPRQKQILLLCKIGKSYALSEIAEVLRIGQQTLVSAPTLRRDVAALCNFGFLTQSGSRKSTKYMLNVGTRNVLLVPSTLMSCWCQAH